MSAERTWPEFVARWIINDQKWCKQAKPEGDKLGFLLRAQWLGILDRDTVKAYFGG